MIADALFRGPQDDSERQLDERAWKADVLDLKRVMSVAKACYLLHEQSNEACARVGLEIATCRVARKVLWWDENWFADEQKHEYFKSVVREKLGIALSQAKGVPPSALEGLKEDTGPAEDPAAVAELRRRLQEAEAVAKAAKAQQQALEASCREALARVAALEASLQARSSELRQQAREAEERLAAAQAAAAAAEAKALELATKAQSKGSEQRPEDRQRIEALERELQQVRQQSEKGSEGARLAELERQLKQGQAERDQLAAKAKEAADRAAKAEAQVRAAEGRYKEQGARRPSAEATVVQMPESPSSALTGPAKERLAEAQRKLEEALRRADDARADKAAAEAELAAMRRQLAAAEEQAAANRAEASAAQARLAALEARSPRGGSPSSQDDEAGGTRRARRGGPDAAELEELRRRAERSDELREKLGRRDATIKELQEENTRLEGLSHRMARTLAQLRDQMSKLQHLAEKKGYGSLLSDIMDESEVNATLNSEEFGCFSRLYEDALRRQKKQKDLEARMGRREDEGRPQGGEHSWLSRGAGGRRPSAAVGYGHNRSSVLGASGVLGGAGGYGGGYGGGGGGGTDDEGHRSHGRDRSGSPLGSDDGDTRAAYDAGYRAGFEAALTHGDSRPSTTGVVMSRAPQRRLNSTLPHEGLEASHGGLSFGPGAEASMDRRPLAIAGHSLHRNSTTGDGDDAYAFPAYSSEGAGVPSRRPNSRGSEGGGRERLIVPGFIAERRPSRPQLHDGGLPGGLGASLRRTSGLQSTIPLSGSTGSGTLGREGHHRSSSSAALGIGSLSPTKPESRRSVLSAALVGGADGAEGGATPTGAAAAAAAVELGDSPPATAVTGAALWEPVHGGSRQGSGRGPGGLVLPSAALGSRRAQTAEGGSASSFGGASGASSGRDGGGSGRVLAPAASAPGLLHGDAKPSTAAATVGGGGGLGSTDGLRGGLPVRPRSTLSTVGGSIGGEHALPSQRRPKPALPLPHVRSAPGELPGLPSNMNVEGSGLGHLYATAGSGAGTPMGRPILDATGGEGEAFMRSTGPRGVMIVSHSRGERANSPDRGPTPRMLWRPPKHTVSHGELSRSSEHLGCGQGGAMDAPCEVQAIGRSIFQPEGSAAITAP